MKIKPWLLLCLTALFAGAAHGQTHFNVGLNGAWFDPVNDGQGLLVEVSPEIQLVSVYWFTYDPTSGEQLWLVGVGDFDNTNGNAVSLDLLKVTEGEFDSPTPVNRQVWGNATLVVSGCHSLQVDYQSTETQTSGRLTLRRVGPDGLCQQLTAGQSSLQVTTPDGGVLSLANTRWGLYDTCVEVSENESWIDETFEFSTNELTITLTQFDNNRCAGSGMLTELQFELAVMGSTQAILQGQNVPASRILVIDPITGQTLRQSFYVESGRLTHARFADDGGTVDDRGYPVELFSVFLERQLP